MKTVSRFSILFLAFYAGWQALSYRIQHLTSPPDPAGLTPWIRLYAGEFDGMETPTMFVFFSLYLAASAWLALRGDGLPWFRSRVVQAACCLPPLALLFVTRSWILSPLPLGDFRGWALVAAGMGLAGLAFLAYGHWTRDGGIRSRLLGIPAWCALAAFIGLSGTPVSVYDYGYFLGPASHILQGEPWGAFFQQYGLGQTLLFAGMMKAGLSLMEMQGVMALAFTLWIFLYARLAARLFSDRGLALLFLFALVLVRFAGFRYYALMVPQTLPLRLDLWVPLVLVWARFGGASPVTAAAFGAGYLFDNLFGALFCGAYLAAVAAGTVFRWGEFNGLKPGRLALLFLPAALACAFQLAVYGAVFSPAGSLYQSLNLGFLPIARRSMFFPLALVLSLSLAVLAKERKPLTLFLFAVAAIQLLYFFGRSHDNNLLNVSGIILICAFLALDRIGSLHGLVRQMRTASVLFITVCAFAFAEGIRERIRHAWDNVAAFRLAARAQEEISADRLEEFVVSRRDRRIVFISHYDAYLNYRFRLPATGPWTPFPAHFDHEETSRYILERLQAGDVLPLVGWDSTVAGDLASSPVWAGSGGRLALVREDGVDILTWIPVSP